MSTYGVRSRFVDMLVRSRGRVSEAAFRNLIAYARERGISAGEARALLQPASYLRTDRELRAHGIRLEDVRFDAHAWAAAEALGRELGLAPLFSELPNVRPADPPPAPAPVPAPAPTLAPPGGQPLGAMSSWRVETSGAVLTFQTQAGGRAHPALVLTSPVWRDPAPARDLVAEHRSELDQVDSLDKLVVFVRTVAARERAYFDASGVAARYNTERYGIQDLRRFRFFEDLAAATSRLRLSAEERTRVPAVLGEEKERMLSDRDYVMETGTHENYWPYWDNFRGAIRKILAQTAPDTDEYFTIKNRLEEIYNRRTVFEVRSEIDEKNLEASIGGAVVHRPQYSAGNGHRVSLAAGSRPTAPRYEVLEVASSDLPAGLEASAGARVFRDTDAAGTLRFDPGGGPLPAALVSRVQARSVSADELGIRPFETGEAARRGIPEDWNRNGQIDVAPIEIAWWGYCHTEAPLNAMGVNPRRGVMLYRAAPGIPEAQALQTFSSDDVWDLFGALTADHEQGYAVRAAFGFSPARVERTKFAGSRNFGGHWFLLEIDRPGVRPIRIDAEVTELWSKTDPTKKYARPEERFRRDLPNDDGTFDPNPDWVASASRDDEEIAIDALGRRMAFISKYITFDEAGERYERKERVELNPANDEWVKIGEEVVDVNPSGGGKLIEHWYNAKQALYYRVNVDVGPDGRRRETGRDTPVRVTRALAEQETPYEGVTDIHDFITKNMGLPFTLDTAAGVAVWNYPVHRLRIDRLRTVARTEERKTYTFTTYRLRYTTMGGPRGDTRYIIKRDEQGNAVRALALDPMPDFAYRNEYWVCAPVAADARGNTALNVEALEAGYLTDKQHDKIVTDLWRREVAICYASLAAPGSGDIVYLFEQSDGALFAFPDEASFRSAVASVRRG